MSEEIEEIEEEELSLVIESNLHVEKFVGQRLSGKPLCLPHFGDSYYYLMAFLLWFFGIMYISQTNYWPSSLPSSTRLIVLGVVIPNFVLELRYFDVFLLKKLLKTFTFWFLLSVQCVHVVATVLHYSVKPEHYEAHHSKDQRDTAIYLSAPLFFLMYLYMIISDAHIYRRGGYRWAKLIVMALLFLNAVRFLVSVQLADHSIENEPILCQYFYCVGTSRMRHVTMFVLGLYAARFTYKVFFLSRFVANCWSTFNIPMA